MDPRSRTTARAVAVAAGVGVGDLRHHGRRIESLRHELLRSPRPTNTRLPHQEPELLPLGEIVARVGKRRGWSRFLGALVRDSGARTVLELGASVGLSAAWLAAGTADSPDAHVHTIEGVPDIAQIARETLASLGWSDRCTVHVGRFKDVLPDVLEQAAPIDIAFVDGDHAGQPTLDYLEQMLPHLSPGAIVVFDDIRWSPGMKQAWSTISERPDTGFRADLARLGLWGPAGDQATVA